MTSHYILHQDQSSEYRGVGKKRLLMIQSSQGRETGRTLPEHVHAGSLFCLSYTFSLWYKTRNSLMNPPRNHNVCKMMAILVEGAERTFQCGQEQNKEAWQTLGNPHPILEYQEAVKPIISGATQQVWDMMTMWKYTSYKPCDTQLFHVNRYVMWTK